jgi:hypothetical protein
MVMNRSALTDLYLDEVKRRGIPARELLAGEKLKAELLQPFYRRRYLSRPLFLGWAERDRLETDLMNLRAALISLPGRLYGGDLTAFARAVGMSDVQISAILRSRAATPTTLTRADLYLDRVGFSLLEFNMGSAIGGIDNAEILKGMLEHPVLAEFVAAHRLDYPDTMREQVKTIKAESGFPPGSRPTMVMTDWPTSYESLAPYIDLYTARLSEMGLDACGAHIGQLEARDGRVWLRDRPVDIIYRLFMIEDLLEYPDAAALVHPILDAAGRGEIKMFTPMDDALYASKGALAMLSDEGNRHLLDPEHLASADRLLPWTRMVRRGAVSLEDGTRVDLLAYVLAHQRELALKPTLLHGGSGVLLGWRADTTPRMWEEQVRAALDGPYVVQRRIEPVLELCPGEDPEPEPWIISWGAFTMSSGFAGVFARGSSVESDVEVINIGTGAYSGSALYAGADAE